VRLVAVGLPYRKIIDTAEAEQVDLIVMATAGRTGFSHLVMGSIAERVVRTATCPVLTIRPRE
jgi:nucleotide-binding universal stress UspA family protein